MSEQLAALDDLNPQVAARLAGVFNDWRATPNLTGRHSARRCSITGQTYAVERHGELSEGITGVNVALSVTIL